MVAVHALRLRWPWVVLLGMPLSVALAYTAYTTVPTPYTAYSELLCQPRRFLFETKEDDPRFDVYKQTVMRMIKDPNVIDAAFRDSAMTKLRYYTEAPDTLVERINKDLRVSSPAQEFIRLELSGQHRHELAAVVNAMVDAYFNVVVKEDERAREERLGELQELLKEENQRLDLAKKHLLAKNVLIEAATAIQGDLKRQAQIDLQLQIRREISQLHPQIIELKLLLNSSDSNAEATVPAPSTEGFAPPEEIQELLSRDGQYAALSRELANSRRMRDEWQKRVQQPHREIERWSLAVEELDKKLADRWEELKPTIQEALQRNRTVASTDGPTTGTRAQLEERLTMLTTLMNTYQKELGTLKTEESKLAVDLAERESFAEDVASIKEVVEVYEKEAEKRRVEQKNAPDPIKVHQEARVPITPDMKMCYLATVAGAFSGVGLVAALFLLLEFQAQRIFEVSQLRSATALPVLGILPQVPIGLHRARTAKQRLTATYWRDVLFEAFDGVQSMLRHNRRCEEARIIMVASSAEGEGKTTATSQLALSFARSGYRVLLIDGDLRRPSLEREFGLSRKPGICEVLKGELSLDDALIHTDLAELDLLPAGQLTDKIRGLLSRDEHAGLLDELSQRYSFVFVDSAPVLLSADTMSLAKHVDGVLMIVRKDVTRVRGLEAALHRFDMIGVPVLGLLTIGLGDSTTMYRSDAYASISLPSPERGSQSPQSVP
ncbi:MAG TPA: polysaccharide biosynthesis tyrosine autokinase, partial [Planctomycetaceae bacterium]|nr:polysaccharide biosynthesis tyrosine autokinase [Planctomycetaceae bacterium]